MKKLMMIVAMMVAAVSANAQFEPGTFSIQPKLGGIGSFLSNTPDYNLNVPDSKQKISLEAGANAGVLIGAEAEYQLTEKFSLGLGLNYAQQGTGWDDYDKEINNVKVSIKDAKVALDYLNIPLVGNIYLFKGFAVKAGVQLGFLLKAKEIATCEMKKGAVTLKYEPEDDIKTYCNKVDFSIPVGVSYQFKVPVVIDARFNIGLTDVYKDEASKNGVFQLTVGYKFAL